MVLSESDGNQANLQVDDLTFENVEYSGVYIHGKNDMHREISERLASGNRCYRGISKLLKSKLLSRKSKTWRCTTYLRPIITYACETEGLGRNVITTDWRYSKERLETFLV